MPPSTAPRSWKEKQRQEREALILQAAEEVFCEKGYHEASIDEIAARVGIAKGTVYLHFPSKEDLLAALFRRDTEQVIAEVEAIAAVPGRSAREKLEEILHLLYGELFKKRTRLFYSMYNSPEMGALLAKKEQMHAHWEQLTSRLEGLLAEGQAAGEFNPELPTSVMLSLFLNLVSVRGYERLVVREGLAPAEVARYLAHIYFKGIAAEH
ncbi:TetR/AcrR family transcriptional regulator [Thermogemmatispora sp.]|uniref:TetR/AcrR family transcriptional regulator n=1 Tax=Thermogemmatispora sp. TaxID=1968838 RepID=UPI001DBE990F|nr:TetR/AcrR family transcriptional regulator [Thermogemmatispora sp.]MBX5449717.1 TetR/AcrR family transcriptional regulator [Thermogemmatispora sp.]